MTIVDFLPPQQANSDVVHLVQGSNGRVTVEGELRLRFDYGSHRP